MTSVHASRTNQLLGYPADARLLLINADDLGMCYAINEAILRTLKEGLARSTSLMMPCPWALHALHLLQENPEIAFGVHLTVICETVNYKWGPLTPKANVPSLVDEAGHFYSLERRAEFLAQADVAELEMEFRAQIETVLAANLEPTHLDWHCLHNGGREDIFDLTLGLAKEYGLAVRVAGHPFAERLQRQGLPTNDHDMLDSFSLDPSDKAARYAQILRDLPAGLSEWAIHPGFDSGELRALQPTGSRVRQTDYDFLMAQTARDIVKEQGIILIGYGELQAVWKKR